MLSWASPAWRWAQYENVLCLTWGRCYSLFSSLPPSLAQRQLLQQRRYGPASSPLHRRGLQP